MLASPTKKNKITLSDYNYRRDIENRLLMSQLSTFEVEVLQEILNSSVTFSLKHLSEVLEAKEKDIIPVLHHLTTTKLLSLQGEKVTVDKELRKYYEFQITKFDDDFRPDVEFILASLSKVPIHALPSWYMIPRNTDNIYASLIEKYLLTPKTYERYLQELNFEDPVMTGIMNDVFAAPDFKVPSSFLREKYVLSEEKFEEYMLLLEYNFVCFLNYNQEGEMWKEVVTPFHEWREYLLFLRDTVPQGIKDVENIRKHRDQDFAFVVDMNSILKVSLQTTLPVFLDDNEYTLALETAITWLPHFGNEDPLFLKHYIKSLIAKILALQLGEIHESHLHCSDSAAAWLKRSVQDQAMLLYRHPCNRLKEASCFPQLYSEKNIREAEKSLKRVVKCGWVYFDEFCQGLTAPIGNAEPVSLKNKGKRWRYVIPSYSLEESKLIKSTIFERLFEVGMVTIGTHQGQLCFCVTPFGRMAIGD